LDIEDEIYTTILDVLMRIQKEQDPSLAFRYACRVNMCGSCGMVINGRERLACKTNVSDLPKGRTISIRPLNHFPIVKDLVVDMDPFFRKYESCLPFFDPKEIREEPAVIRPDAGERQAIGLATECIACGCCVSSCTMVNYHDGYAGPASLNRAFTLLMDSRDGLYEERMARVLQSCYHCRTEFNCTEVCPKEISCTRAIKYIQRLAMREPFRAPARKQAQPTSAVSLPQIQAAGTGQDGNVPGEDMGRRRFLSSVTLGIGGLCTLGMGGILASAFVGPSLSKKPARWMQVGKLDDFPPGEVSTVQVNWEETRGFYRQQWIKPILIWRRNGGDEIVVYRSTCTHLGCTVHWDANQRLFLCACHGGAFNLDGTVKSGPPPRPLDRLAFRTENRNLLVEVA
jgi:succinate dehydrogenase / fumarate reductase iron-sulfur subunit